MPVRIFATHRHGQACPVGRQLARPLAQQRVDGEHVIQGRHLEAFARAQEEAEVLGVAVGCAQHPEQQLRHEEVKAVTLALGRAIQHGHDAFYPRATVGLVLQHGRCAGGLAHVLLRQAQQRVAVPYAPVKALHAQHFQVFKAQYFARCHWQAIGGQQLCAQPFVFYRMLHVQLQVADQPQGQFEDVGGGCGAQGAAPAPLPEQQGILFLRPRNRDAEIIGHARIAQCPGLGQGADALGHGVVAHGFSLHAQVGGRLIARGQDLQRPHAVPPHFTQQGVGVCGTYLVAARYPLANVLAVGQQVLKVETHCVAFVWAVARREGQRQ